MARPSPDLRRDAARSVVGLDLLHTEVEGHVQDADPVLALPDILALAITGGLHLWRRNAVLSILGGTASYVALASTLFAR
jgi:branched-subunit amino acid transport protein AzlD